MTHGEEVRTRHSSSIQTSRLAELPLKYVRSAACEICGLSTFLCEWAVPGREEGFCLLEI